MSWGWGGLRGGRSRALWSVVLVAWVVLGVGASPAGAQSLDSLLRPSVLSVDAPSG